MFALLALMSALVSLDRKLEASRGFMVLSFGGNAEVAAIVSTILTWLPFAHWTHQSRSMHAGFIILAVIVTLLLILSVDFVFEI
jgi:hypothetical protein